MQKALTILLAAMLAAGFAVAGDRSLRTDLTPEDLARVTSITAPTTDFSKPEKFEQLPAGAATSKKIVNRDSFSHFSANLSFAAYLFHPPLLYLCSGFLPPSQGWLALLITFSLIVLLGRPAERSKGWWRRHMERLWPAASQAVGLAWPRGATGNKAP